MRGLPLHILDLKESFIVILLRNLNVVQGLLKGPRIIVHKMYDNSIYLEIASRVNAGQRTEEKV